MNTSVKWQDVASELFSNSHCIVEKDHVLSGTAQVGQTTVAVIGTTDHTEIGIEIALIHATAVLETVRMFPQRPIIILVDTKGQRLRHRDEMLGLNSYMAHLGKCIEYAREQGHPILALVYDQALSGGFITSGLMADACYALPEVTIRVMGIPAMARITKVPESQLTELAKHNPVFAPGPENYLRMGGLTAIWHSDLAVNLQRALAQTDPIDRRSELGFSRGGRTSAQPVIDTILVDSIKNIAIKNTAIKDTSIQNNDKPASNANPSNAI
jgi:malonate decarboxylase gamma subunit